jgi:hypothetical protein
MIKYKKPLTSLTSLTSGTPRTLRLTKETLVQLSGAVLNKAALGKADESGLSVCWPCPTQTLIG